MSLPVFFRASLPHFVCTSFVFKRYQPRNISAHFLVFNPGQCCHRLTLADPFRLVENAHTQVLHNFKVLKIFLSTFLRSHRSWFCLVKPLTIQAESTSLRIFVVAFHTTNHLIMTLMPFYKSLIPSLESTSLRLKPTIAIKIMRALMHLNEK